MLAAAINGERVADLQRAISVEDRGLAFGDGVFETMLLHNGSVRFLDDHFQRLYFGCAHLGISKPGREHLLSDLDLVAGQRKDGIVKLIVTRGGGERGYRISPDIQPTRIVLLYPPAAPESDDG